MSLAEFIKNTAISGLLNKSQVARAAREVWPNTLRTIVFGDSLTALGQGTSGTVSENFLSDGTSYFNGGGATSQVSTVDTGWFTFADFLMNGCHQLVRNAAIGGNTTTDMLARVDADVLSYKPTRIYDLSGTNDIVLDFGSGPTITNKISLLAKYASIDAQVVLISILPRQIFTAAQRNAAIEVNQWMASIAARNKNIFYVDVFSLWCDPLTGNPIANRTYDGTHETNLGSFLIGREIARKLSKFSAPWDYVPRGAAESYLLNSAAIIRNDNPLMAAGTGGTFGTGFSGVVAQGYDCARIGGAATVAMSIIPHPQGYGYAQRMTITFTGTAGEGVYFGTPNLNGRWLAGRLLEAQCDVSVMPGSPEILKALTLSAGATTTGGVSSTVRAMEQTPGRSPQNVPYGADGMSGRLRTPRLFMPGSACSTWNNRLNIYSDTAGTITIDVSLFAARMVPATPQP